MKKFLVFKENTDKLVKEYYPDVLYWINNNKDQELGSIEKYKYGRKGRVGL